MHGFLNINKPAGLTSHDVVARIRRLAGKGVKVGHAGTLDPAATGVLPVALGPATRLIEYLASARKGYRAVVRLGTTTTTDDAEGDLVAQQPVPALDETAIEAALKPFRGTIMQVPPIYSALHHSGKRLYELARAGETVDVPPRPVTIDRLELIDMPTSNDLVLDVECSKGTYIRALARDLGASLGCGAHLAALARTFVGPFSLEQATPLADLEADAALLDQALLPPAVAVADWPVVVLNPDQSQHVRHGRSLALPHLTDEYARAHTADGTLLALLRRKDDMWHPEKVFA